MGVEGRPDTVTLETLARGAAVELFQKELDGVVKNVADPNTDPTAVRQIMLTVKIKPSVDRDEAVVGIQCVSKLASVKGTGSRFFFGVKNGKPVVVEGHDPRQSGLFDEKPKPTAVTPLRKE